MDIQNFISKINELGLARLNKFEVIITPPPVMLGLGSTTAILNNLDTINIFCEASFIPGITITTTDVRRHGVGQLEKKPHIPNFSDWSCTFLGDGQGDLLNFFQQWIKEVVNFTGAGRTADRIESSSGLGVYEVNYKEDFSSTLTINILNENDKNIIQIKLYDAFPINIPDIQINRGDNDSIMKIPVTFSYREWATSKFLTPRLTETVGTVSIELENPNFLKGE